MITITVIDKRAAWISNFSEPELKKSEKDRNCY